MTNGEFNKAKEVSYEEYLSSKDVKWERWAFYKVNTLGKKFPWRVGKDTEGNTYKCIDPYFLRLASL